MTQVIVAGALANKPDNGGEAWVRLSWVRALESLGFQVLFLEEVAPEFLGGWTPHPRGNGAEAPASLEYFRRVVRDFDLKGRAAVVDRNGRWAWGMHLNELEARVKTSHMLVNIGGHLTCPALFDQVPCRVYVDIDPGFTHFWEARGIQGARLEGHHHYFTIGENVGRKECLIPTLGLRWHPIRQPVVLSDWSPVPDGRPDRFTTVANWRGPFGPVQFGGRTFGLKVHEFRRFIEFPTHARGTFEIALNIHPDDRADLERLESNGWVIVDPRDATGDPTAFRRYIQGSGAEFSVAQGIYVDTRSGWFSDRSTRYLACGKPVLVQDTGLNGVLPTGEGLLTFTTLDEARDGARQILEDYGAHSQAARHLARDHFSPRAALDRLLDVTGVVP
ncbi:MAG: glycosyltransferase [bacterium]